MRLIWPCVVVVASGCGFKATSSNQLGPGDAATDAPVTTDGGSVDSSIDGGPSTCFTRWMTGSVTKLEGPTALPNLSDGGIDERDPWLTANGLELYYTHQPDPANGGDADIYHATRASTAVDFPAGARVDSVSSSSGESRATLTADGTQIAFASDRASSGTFLIYTGTRGGATGDFGNVNATHTGTINVGGGSRFDPFLTADGLELYYAPTPMTGVQHVAVASRASADVNFGPANFIFNIVGEFDADPALSPDQRIIVFSSDRAGVGLTGANLWYATRASPTGTFGTPTPIPTVNTGNEGDPFLSEDGCTLYFTRKNATFDLYKATVSPLP